VQGALLLGDVEDERLALHMIGAGDLAARHRGVADDVQGILEFLDKLHDTAQAIRSQGLALEDDMTGAGRATVSLLEAPTF
jgi:hypothetical protein